MFRDLLRVAKSFMVEQTTPMCIDGEPEVSTERALQRFFFRKKDHDSAQGEAQENKRMRTF